MKKKETISYKDKLSKPEEKDSPMLNIKKKAQWKFTVSISKAITPYLTF